MCMYVCTYEVWVPGAATSPSANPALGTPSFSSHLRNTKKLRTFLCGGSASRAKDWFRI